MKNNNRLIIVLVTLGFFFATSPQITTQAFESSDNNSKDYSFLDFKLSAADYSNVTVISDGYNGVYWNDDSSYSPSITVDDSGTIHVVWSDDTDGIWGTDLEIMYANYTEATGWSNITVISDGYNGVYWNDGSSSTPKIAADNSGGIHVVWVDFTSGVWGTDMEIMHASYTETTGWSNITIVSDGYNGVYWNDDFSYEPSITIDNSGGIHVAWRDDTDGPWGTDTEIMYANYTEATGWSNITIISDGYNGVYWNDGTSYGPSIVVDDSGSIHVVWCDTTDGTWGTDNEIMYASYTEATGWSNITIVSDGYNGIYWNDGSSNYPHIAVDSSAGIHVVWHDSTDGMWGTDMEIMYTSYTEATGWSNATVISDGYGGIYWNNEDSYYSKIATDNMGGIYVVWYDYTEGMWGTDTEIMYVSYVEETGWSNITIVSDGYNGTYWNDGSSSFPDMCVDNSGGIHIVWTDTTDGTWGTDTEIMATTVSIPSNGNGKGIPFGNIYLYFTVATILGLVIYIKKKITNI